jgi:hypothetical protein
VKALYNQNNSEFQSFLKQPFSNRNRIKLLITPEMELDLDQPSERLIFIRQPSDLSAS